MNYVEWLRVGRCLKWTAIALAIVAALIIVVDYVAADEVINEVSLHGTSLHDLEKRGNGVEQTLPGGVKRTVYDDPAGGVRVTVDDRGYWGKRIEIFKRAGSNLAKVVSIGPIAMHQTPVPGGTLLSIETNAPQDLAYYAGIGGFVALIVATLLGAPFARENDGHLEIALTKPIARVPLALGIMGADVAGIVGSWLLAVAALFVAHIASAAPNYVVGPLDLQVIVLGLLGAIAWYALLTAATSRLNRAYGAILGAAWPVAALIVVLARVHLGDSALAKAITALATPLSWIDPFNYLHFGLAYSENGKPHGALAVSFGTELPSLLALALVYGAIAILVWRRVEA